MLALGWAALFVALSLGVRARWEGLSVPSASMEPTLLPGDSIIVDKSFCTPTRGDLIVFRDPNDPDQLIVKRVIGVGGEDIHIEDDRVYVDCKPRRPPCEPLAEPYADFGALPVPDEPPGDWHVPPDSVFVTAGQPQRRRGQPSLGHAALGPDRGTPAAHLLVARPPGGRDPLGAPGMDRSLSPRPPRRPRASIRATSVEMAGRPVIERWSRPRARGRRRAGGGEGGRAMKHGFRVMDSDLHTMEPDDLWERHLDERFRKFAPRFERVRSGPPNQPTIRIGELTIGAMTVLPSSVRAAADLHRRAFARHPHYEIAHARGYDAASHLAAMDIEGIDVAVLYGTRGRQVQMHDDLDPGLAAALARAHNDWTREYCQADPARLKFAAQISFHDVGLAVKEARRAVRELGAVAVVGNPNPVNGRHVHDPYFEPLWSAVEELGVPVGFHPTGLSSLRDDVARRLWEHPNGRAIGTAARNPVELMLAFASLAAGGVLERHPGLRCAFLEGTCGWLPWWLWRLDETWEKFGPGSEVPLSCLPSEYFLRQCYVATDADEKVLRQVVEAVGDDNIVVSTDYPHSDGLFPTAIEQFVGLEGVGDKTKAKILWDNCARLYPLAAGREHA